MNRAERLDGRCGNQVDPDRLERRLASSSDVISAGRSSQKRGGYRLLGNDLRLSGKVRTCSVNGFQ
jgi:hypothetical protein